MALVKVIYKNRLSVLCGPSKSKDIRGLNWMVVPMTKPDLEGMCLQILIFAPATNIILVVNKI